MRAVIGWLEFPKVKNFKISARKIEIYIFSTTKKRETNFWGLEPPEQLGGVMLFRWFGPTSDIDPLQNRRDRMGSPIYCWPRQRANANLPFCVHDSSPPTFRIRHSTQSLFIRHFRILFYNNILVIWRRFGDLSRMRTGKEPIIHYHLHWLTSFEETHGYHCIQWTECGSHNFSATILNQKPSIVVFQIAIEIIS